MKNIVFIFLFSLFLTSCGGVEENENANNPDTQPDNNSGDNTGNNTPEDNPESEQDEENSPPESDDSDTSTPETGAPEPDDNNSDNNPNNNAPDEDENSQNPEGGPDTDPNPNPEQEEDCQASTIKPFVQVIDNGEQKRWNQTLDASLAPGQSLRFGPQASGPGTWLWTGCGASGTNREHLITPSESCLASVTFTRECGTSTTATYKVTIVIPPNPVGEGRAKLFLMSGQSNMVGHGGNNNLQRIANNLLAPREDVWVKSIIEPNKKFGPLAPGYGRGNGNFGVELKMGQVLGDALSENIYMYKAAKGGTTLDSVDEWRPPAYGGTAGNLYEQMMQGFAEFRSQELAEIEYDIAGFVWFQGWNDAKPDQDARYEEHLRNLLQAVRADLELPNLPVIIVQMNDGRGVSSDIVMAAQAKVANEDARNSLVITSDQRPYFHYDSGGYVAIGERIAQAALPLFDLPASRIDEFTVAPNSTFVVNGSEGVLVNDSGSELSAELIETSQHGELSLKADGGFEYTPEPGYRGQDSFTYRVTANGKVGNISEVTLWVRPANDPLVLHYNFDKTDLDNQIDLASGFPARILKEGVTLGHAGLKGNAAYFNGNGLLHALEHYPIPKLLDFSTSRDFSISTWVKVDTPVSEEQVLISNQHTLRSSRGLALTILPDGISAFVASVSKGTHKSKKSRLNAETTQLNEGAWHHIALSVNFSEQLMTLYLDGEPVAETSVESLDGDINQNEFAVGDGPAGGDEKSKAFIGYMDELRVYSAALSREQIEALATP